MVRSRKGDGEAARFDVNCFHLNVSRFDLYCSDDCTKSLTLDDKCEYLLSKAFRGLTALKAAICLDNNAQNPDINERIQTSGIG